MKSRILTARSIAILVLMGLMVPFSAVLAGPLGDDPAAVADHLHEAISTGDAEGIHELLDPDVLIFESGGVESSLEEYASHHMHSDMAFMAEMKRELLNRDVFENGALAVVSSRSKLAGRYQGEDIELFGTETLVLERTGQAWKIKHIHWSSRPGG